MATSLSWEVSSSCTSAASPRALKALILRIGGVRLYRRAAPVFVGLVLGQIFAVSVVWQIFARFTPEEWKRLADPLIYF